MRHIGLGHVGRIHLEGCTPSLLASNIEVKFGRLVYTSIESLQCCMKGCIYLIIRLKKGRIQSVSKVPD